MIYFHDYAENKENVYNQIIVWDGTTISRIHLWSKKNICVFPYSDLKVFDNPIIWHVRFEIKTIVNFE